MLNSSRGKVRAGERRGTLLEGTLLTPEAWPMQESKGHPNNSMTMEQQMVVPQLLVKKVLRLVFLSCHFSLKSTIFTKCCLNLDIFS